MRAYGSYLPSDWRKAREATRDHRDIATYVDCASIERSDRAGSGAAETDRELARAPTAGLAASCLRPRLIPRSVESGLIGGDGRFVPFGREPPSRGSGR